MLIAFCDRCGNEIPDFDAEKDQITFVNGTGHAVEDFDLCSKCRPTIEAQISDFIKGA